VSTYDPTQDEYLPPPAVTQSACGSVFQNHVALLFDLSEQLPGSIVQFKSLSKILLSDFLIREINKSAKIFRPVVGKYAVYMAYFGR